MPIIGLLFFAWLTYDSYRGWQAESSHGKHFWWSIYRLDSDPLNRHPRPALQKPNDGSGPTWDLRELVHPGLLEVCFLLSGSPAFLLSRLIVAALSRLGVSQVLTFMIATPILLFAWYYFLGWLLDRWRRKPQRAPVNT